MPIDFKQLAANPDLQSAAAGALLGGSAAGIARLLQRRKRRDTDQLENTGLSPLAAAASGALLGGAAGYAGSGALRAGAAKAKSVSDALSKLFRGDAPAPAAAAATARTAGKAQPTFLSNVVGSLGDVAGFAGEQVMGPLKYRAEASGIGTRDYAGTSLQQNMEDAAAGAGAGFGVNVGLRGLRGLAATIVDAGKREAFKDVSGARLIEDPHLAQTIANSTQPQRTALLHELTKRLQRNSHLAGEHNIAPAMEKLQELVGKGSNPATTGAIADAQRGVREALRQHFGGTASAGPSMASSFRSGFGVGNRSMLGLQLPAAEVAARQASVGFGKGIRGLRWKNPSSIPGSMGVGAALNLLLAGPRSTDSRDFQSPEQ